MRKSVVGMVGVAVALMLAACGSVGSITSQIIAPCKAIFYQNILWSPDGKHIAFDASPLNDPPHIYVMNADGTNIRRLGDSPLFITGLRWLSDSQTIVYSDYQAIYKVTLDGTVIKIPFDAYGAPLFASSPDGMTMVIQPSTIGLGPILLVDQVSGGTTQLTEGNEQLEEWSPDGTYIAYLSLDGQQTFVSTMKADGSDQRQLAAGYGSVHWSPDGQWISFGIESNVHIVRPNGTDETRVTDYIHFYGWLPDSQHISFNSDYPNRPLKVIDIKTLAVETITTIPAYNWSWSPDAAQVVFVGPDNPSSAASVQEIYIVNRDGTGLTRLTDNPGKYQCLQWPF